MMLKHHRVYSLPSLVTPCFHYYNMWLLSTISPLSIFLLLTSFMSCSYETSALIFISFCRNMPGAAQNAKQLWNFISKSKGFDGVLKNVNNKMYLAMKFPWFEILLLLLAADYNTILLHYFFQVELISAGNGCCKCKLTVSEEHTNTGGTLHGGMTATMVDTISTMALLTTKPYSPGVSVDLSVS